MSYFVTHLRVLSFLLLLCRWRRHGDWLLQREMVGFLGLAMSVVMHVIEFRDALVVGAFVLNAHEVQQGHPVLATTSFYSFHDLFNP